MRDLMRITKALADETRIRALLALREGELCACQVTEVFGLAPSTMSKHLSILYQAGLVESRKAGRWAYFRLPRKDSCSAVSHALEWILAAAESQPRVKEDARVLKRIRKMDPSEICKRQGGK